MTSYPSDPSNNPPSNGGGLRVLIKRFTSINHVTTVNAAQNSDASRPQSNYVRAKWILLYFCMLLLVPLHLLLVVVLLPLCYATWMCLPCILQEKDKSCGLYWGLCVLWPIGPIFAALFIVVELMNKICFELRWCLAI